jgi:dihydrofolate reductase
MKLIVAACEGMGIGKNNDLPWKLKKEMAYFTRDGIHQFYYIPDKESC